LQRFGRLGHVKFLTDVVEQRLADQLFQLTNLQADGRLGEGHFLGRPAVGAQITHLIEDLQLT